nr:hypothetical protein [Tanacetum cinerariifolium]
MEARGARGVVVDSLECLRETQARETDKLAALTEVMVETQAGIHEKEDDQMNSVINCLTAKSTHDDLIMYHEGPSDVKESGVMDLKLCYNTFKFKEGEILTQNKALMNELVNNGIKLSKLEINIGLINGLPKKWLSFCQSLRNTNHVKESELAFLFGKLKYEENLIDSIYETEKKKSLVSATPLSTAFFSTSIIQDFQDSPDDEEDTRSSQEYMDDLKEEYQARALLAKSKRLFKKGTQRFSSAKETDQSECHNCGRKELRPTKYFEANYNKVKAKLALLSLSVTTSKASMVKNKWLIPEAYEWDEEKVSSDDNEMVKVKVLMALDDDNVAVSKEVARNGEWVKISMRKDNPSKVTKNTIDPSVAVTDSSATNYDSADEFSVCSTPLPPLEKLVGAEPISGPQTIK